MTNERPDLSAPTIGSRITRLEDEPLLRGRGRFIDDISLPGVWHAAFVRSPHPHALITGIDKAAALAVPGVRAVLTLDDIAPVMAMRRMVRHSNSGMPLDKDGCKRPIVPAIHALQSQSKPSRARPKTGMTKQ
jgi:CO/xanthine dehydrogenase Mo-binding subunit